MKKHGTSVFSCPFDGDGDEATVIRKNEKVFRPFSTDSNLESRTCVRRRSAPNVQNAYASIFFACLLHYIISFVLLKYAGVQKIQDLCTPHICTMISLDSRLAQVYLNCPHRYRWGDADYRLKIFLCATPG